jgi:hypothetical protein
MSQRAYLAETYQALHEGLPMRQFVREAPVARPGRVRPLGRLEAIVYEKDVPEGPGGSAKGERYKHPFAPYAQPMLGVDARGKLHVLSGRFVVTTHGIEDRAPRHVAQERLPSTRPRGLVTLGKLERIQYRNAATGESETIEFIGPQRPVLAHDTSGTALYALHGRYSIEVKENTMARRRRSRTRKNPFAILRANPSGGSVVQQAQSVGMNAVVNAVLGVATIVALEKAAQVPAIATRLTNPYGKAAAKAAVGIAAGVALMRAMPTKKGIGAAVAVGGTTAGALDALHTYQSTPAAGAYLPGGQVGYLPAGGVPAGFGVMNREVCGVR